MCIKKLSGMVSESFLISFEVTTLLYFTFIPYGKYALCGALFWRYFSGKENAGAGKSAKKRRGLFRAKPFALRRSGRGDVIRTRDLLVPNQARYQTALLLVYIVLLYQNRLLFASDFHIYRKNPSVHILRFFSRYCSGEIVKKRIQTDDKIYKRMTKPCGKRYNRVI